MLVKWKAMGKKAAVKWEVVDGKETVSKWEVMGGEGYETEN